MKVNIEIEINKIPNDCSKCRFLKELYNNKGNYIYAGCLLINEYYRYISENGEYEKRLVEIRTYNKCPLN
jgi:hypothetical protein